mmetsp:Transcript_19504/g.61356  ORF Transcript_19504/g.61356 Transcript_19504/m.61356 type:complete len:268 (-) Transcript_19504:669-1472(-)
MLSPSPSISWTMTPLSSFVKPSFSRSASASWTFRKPWGSRESYCLNTWSAFGTGVSPSGSPREPKPKASLSASATVFPTLWSERLAACESCPRVNRPSRKPCMAAAGQRSAATAASSRAVLATAIPEERERERERERRGLTRGIPLYALRGWYLTRGFASVVEAIARDGGSDRRDDLIGTSMKVRLTTAGGGGSIFRSFSRTPRPMFSSASNNLPSNSAATMTCRGFKLQRFTASVTGPNCSGCTKMKAPPAATGLKRSSSRAWRHC